MRRILHNKKDNSRSYFEFGKLSLPKSKRSAEMTIGTIIIIILAILVLAFLIYGFSTGWNNLWQNIKNNFGGGSNVDTIVRACQAACTTQGTYEYCKLREVKFSANEPAEQLSCKNLESKPVGLGSCESIQSCPETCKFKPDFKANCGDYKGEVECAKGIAFGHCVWKNQILKCVSKRTSSTDDASPVVPTPSCTSLKIEEQCTNSTLPKVDGIPVPPNSNYCVWE